MITYGVFKYKNNLQPKYSSCIEYVYLANNESVFNGISIKEARENFGIKLWQEESEYFKNDILQNKNDYIVSYVPNTAYHAALGYSKKSDIRFCKILSVKKKGRTFIISNQKERINALHEKFQIDVSEIHNNSYTSGHIISSKKKN